jgi:hypothetical protein
MGVWAWVVLGWLVLALRLIAYAMAAAADLGAYRNSLLLRFALVVPAGFAALIVLCFVLASLEGASRMTQAAADDSNDDDIDYSLDSNLEFMSNFSYIGKSHCMLIHYMLIHYMLIHHMSIHYMLIHYMLIHHMSIHYMLIHYRQVPRHTVPILYSYCTHTVPIL